MQVPAKPPSPPPLLDSPELLPLEDDVDPPPSPLLEPLELLLLVLLVLPVPPSSPPPELPELLPLLDDAEPLEVPDPLLPELPSPELLTPEEDPLELPPAGVPESFPHAIAAAASPRESQHIARNPVMVIPPQSAFEAISNRSILTDSGPAFGPKSPICVASSLRPMVRRGAVDAPYGALGRDRESTPEPTPRRAQIAGALPNGRERTVAGLRGQVVGPAHAADMAKFSASMKIIHASCVVATLARSERRTVRGGP
jgi:hypothetical protein